MKINYFKNTHHSQIKYRKFSFILIFFIGGLLIIFNDLGLIRWYQLKSERIKIQNAIDLQISEQLRLKDELDQLKNDSEYIKKIAKERFQMVKPGEKIFRVRDKRTIK
tara:strand:- start:4502 stop:4825 length:324 start_codon:yes stop_codon:yes gene_type:complete